MITGSTGFIGRALALALMHDGWSVHALVRPTSDKATLPTGVAALEFDGDIAELTERLRALKPDVVFHLASLYLADHAPAQVGALVESNILFATQLAEAMTGAGVTRLVNTGTAWQHFGTAVYNPVNLYAATKQAALDVLRYYHDARQLSVVTLELFDTYGPGDTRRKLVQLLVDAALDGASLGMSPGEQLVDLTHIDDVVGAFLVAAERLEASDTPLDERFFVAGDRMSVRELAVYVADTLGRPVDARFGERPYRQREVMVPPVAHPLCPRWTRRRSLHEGIAALVTVVKR